MFDLIGREHFTHVHGPLCSYRATVKMMVVLVVVVVVVLVVIVV
jgi:hypothetical protein